MPDEYLVEINNHLEVLLKSHSLEVWIDTVIRDFKLGETTRLLKAVEVKLKVCLYYFSFSNAQDIQDDTTLWPNVAAISQNQTLF